MTTETLPIGERIGLLSPPPRTGGSYRFYRRSHRERLSFVRRGRDVGFSLDAVRDLLRLSDYCKRSCAEIDKLARAHPFDVENKHIDLVELRRVLRQLIDQSQHGTVAKCRIIEVLARRP